jgi:hypothetical protein
MVYDTTSDRIRIQHPQGWHSHTIRHRTRREWILDPEPITTDTVPWEGDTNALPTHWLTDLPDDFRCSVPRQIQRAEDSSVDTPAELQLAFLHPTPDPLPTWTSDYTRNAALGPGTIASLLLALQTGANIHAGVAGISTPTQATYGWALGTHAGTGLTGHGHVTSQPSKRQRALLCGNVALLLALYRLLQAHHIMVHPHSTLIVQTDGDALRKAFKDGTRLYDNTLQPDWDVRVLLRHVSQTLPVTIQYHNIRGLPSMAITHHHHTESSLANTHPVQANKNPESLPNQWDPIGLYNFEGRITSFEGKQLQEAVSERDYIDYIYQSRMDATTRGCCRLG